MTLQQHDDAASEHNSAQQSADLRRFHLAHLALRTHADDICRGLAAMRPGDTERAAALNSLWNIYQAALRGHNSAEDSLCWPAASKSCLGANATT